MTATPFSGTHSGAPVEFDFFGMIRRRVLLSIATTIGWLSVILLYIAFWAHYFSLFQSVIVVVVSLLILSGILLGAWVSFGMQFGGRWRY